ARQQDHEWCGWAGKSSVALLAWASWTRVPVAPRRPGWSWSGHAEGVAATWLVRRYPVQVLLAINLAINVYGRAHQYGIPVGGSVGECGTRRGRRARSGPVAGVVAAPRVPGCEGGCDGRPLGP